MKSLLIVFLLSCLGAAAQTEVSVYGYRVNANNDTLLCNIKVAGKKKVTGYGGLVIKTPEGEEQVFNAKDKQVLAYGFQYNGVQFHYRFVEVGRNYESGFFRLIDDGKKYKLYVNYLTDYNNGVAVTLPHYAIFKPNGEYKDLTTHVLGNWKKNLRAILSDNPEALQELETINRKEIEQFVKKLNLAE